MARQPVLTEVATRNESETDKALAAPKDLRAYLQKLVEYDPRQLMVVEKEIDPIFEATAIVDQMRTDARYPNYPAVLFRRIKGSSIPLLINLQGTYERLALAIDSNLRGMVEEFGRRESFADYDCRKIKYMSDGLKIVGFIWKPKNISGRKLPLVIVNRGGNPNLSLLTPQSFYYPYVTNGFVVIGSQYRGADGGEGADEYGGADVDDVLNLIPLARGLGYVDMNNVFMHGASRGGMEAFRAIEKGMPVNAVSVNGALTDLPASAKERPAVAERVWSKLIPGFAEKSEEAMRERSAVYFADKINVPVLILQGGADWRSNTGSQALGLATKLQSLGKTYELHVYAGDDHPLSINRLEKERKIVEWFKRYMK